MMPMAGTRDDIEADFETLEAIGAHVEDIVERLVSPGAIQKTLRRWLIGHADLPEDDDALVCLSALAADLEMFTPSLNGRTMVDRYLKVRKPKTAEDRQVFQALSAAQFRLVRIIDREGPDLVRLKDLVTGETIQLLDARLSALAAGQATAMRLCPLESGRHVLISPLFAIDESMLEESMTFVRHGRPLGTGHRCAASLYRTVARRGFQPMPQLFGALDDDTLFDFLSEVEESLSPVQRLALRWIEAAEGDPDLELEARGLASVDNLVDALGCFAQDDWDGAPKGLRAAFEQIAALQVETIAGRARAGVHGAAQMLDQVAAEVANHIALGEMDAGARPLFDRLRQRSSFSGAKNPAGTASAEATEIDRVIQRIQGLRAKTADRGCTEAEAIAAAAKVSELLARHDLTLDEVSVRRSDCEGVSVATGRKRRAPVDTCAQSVAAFCDCRVWGEQGADGGLGFVFFGLRTDVEAARFMHDLIGVTFDTESATFRRREIYQSLRGGDRRTALNSFQIGLANGICSKLTDLKAARQGSNGQSTGFDLVAVKHAVLEDEISRLGLHFTSRTTTSRRYVQSDAYHAGRVAG
ncbi:MAG: hypothetical protein RL367_926, partial [Pseudomonadota bacterium]